MVKETLWKYFFGHFTRLDLKKRFLPASLLIVFSFLLIAYLLYPPERNYTIFKDTISELGDFVDNPNGWWGFPIAICALSLSYFPLFLYIHRRLACINRKMVYLGSFSALFGSACLFLIGIFVDANTTLIGGLTFAQVHTAFVNGEFGGVSLGILIYGLIFIQDSLSRSGGQQVLFLRYRFLPPYIILYSISAGMGVSAGMGIFHPDIGGNGPGLLSVSFWEWMLLFGTIAWMFWIVLILPEQIPERPGPSTP